MYDCLIIGAGQFGIACADKLKTAGANVLIVDAGERVGDVWRRRPRRLRLFTSRRFCTICGIPMSGDPDGYPSGEEFGDYLAEVARRLGLEVALSSRVERLERAGGDGSGPFLARFADGRSVYARAVVNATGANQAQRVPAFAAGLDAKVRQLAAGAYRDPDDIGADALVCVVGDGASGRQIALELAESGRRVALARGRRRKLLPNRVLGRDLFWWLSGSGAIYAKRDGLLARIMRKRDPIPAANCSDRILAARGVRLMPRATGAEGRAVAFADGSRLEADAVIWCGGYEERMDWIALPRIRAEHDLSGDYGRTPEPGFYAIGRRWLTTRASELVLGVERDAERIVADVRTYLRHAAPAETAFETAAHDAR